MKDVKQMPQHYLTLGRLLYQAGALEAAEAFYSRVPRGSPQFISARTERTWVLLRLGRVGELRGELQSLSHKVFDDQFQPEVALVRAISNLKLCRYADVAQDFQAFITSYSKWGKRIEEGLAQPETAKLDVSDKKVTVLTEAIASREKEEARLETLARDSIKAALPAVGEQPHWIAARSTLASAREEQKRELTQQKTRFWKNREAVLTEVIRKMKFVRVEAMNQVRLMAQDNKTEAEVTTDTISKIQAARARGSQSYPFEGVYWPDELFQLFARAQSRCEGK
jgi:hypothetical protein